MEHKIRKTAVWLAAAVAMAVSAPPRAALAAAFSNVWTATLLEDGQSAAWADFDADGDLDLLVGNSGAPNRVYSKDASVNTYTLLWSSTESDATYSAAWGDFDGDGDLDHVAGNSGVATRLYLKNNGLNTFAAPSTIATSDTRAVAAGDLDGDGDLDLFTGNFGAPSVVYLNNGSGVFSSSWASALSNNTESVAIGDADGDGDADLLVGNNPNANFVYINAGTGASFTSWQTTEADNTTDVEWGDYDADGDLDFAAANNSQANRVYRNNGNNTFTLVWSSVETEQSTSISWGDNDADGDLDILVGNTSQANRIYAKGAGDTFSISYTSGETDPTNDVAWGDYDGSGDLDYAAANGAAAGIRVYANDDNPSNTAPSTPSLIARTDTQTGSVTLQWNASSDDHTPAALIGYIVRVGTSSGGNNIISGVFTGYPGNAGPGATSITLSMANTGIYYWSVSAIDGSGRQSAWATQDSFILDNTAPSTIATVYDGYAAAQDFAYASSSTQLSANWTASIDAESGLAAYYYGIGSTAGTTDIRGWTSNATSTSVTATGLSLTNNNTYFFTIKAVNNAGLETASPTNSNGQKVDTTAPASTAPVNDGTGADVDFASSTTQLSANWTASSDAESGINSYWYAIGTTPGGAETVTWTSNGTNTSVTRTGLGLSNGTPYYFSVKARNNAGVDESPMAISDGQTPDTSPPSDVATVNDGTGADVTHTTSGSQLSANWTASTDAISGISAYYYAIGTTQGGTNVVGWTNNGTNTSVTRTGLTLADGATYYFSVKAVNGAMLESAPTNSSGQMSDTTGPSDISSVNDGTGADVTYSTSGSQLSANWTASSDAHSGIPRYWYSIGTTIGGTDALNWTDNGPSTSVTKTGLSLTDGVIYYVNVKAENGSGLQSNITTSNGQKVDASAPTGITVSDGAGSDIAFQALTDQLTANWTAATDSHTGVVKYYYAIGTSAGGTDVVPWTDNGTNISVTKTGLTLAGGQTYFFSVKAENNAGLQSTPANSNGVTVDTSAPADVAAVNDGAGADADYTTDNSQLTANWPASSDAQSGIAKYWYAIGTSSGGTDIAGWTDNGNNTSVTRTGLGLPDGSIYYFSVKAQNNAGLQSAPVNSDGQTVDTTPPDSVTVSDGTGADTDFFSDNTQLSANWTPSQDLHSGVAKYWYAIGTSAGGTDIAGWTDNGNNTSVTRTGLSLANGTTYYFSVKPENNAGIQGSVTSSDGQYVDNTPPADVATVNDGGAADVDFGTSGSQLGANWSASSDGESGVLQYWYSIGTSPGASDTVGWTSAGLVTAATATGLSLADGATYFISIKAENTAGLFSTPVSSDGRLVDTSAPAAVASIKDGPDSDIDYATTSVSSLDANWTAATDLHSGITNYFYSIGTTSGGCTSEVYWTDNGTATSVTHGGLSLTNGSTYIICVMARNGAGLFSNPAQSDGFTIDTTPPADITAVNDGAGTDITYMSSTTQMSANWTASSDVETGVAKYWYSVGTSAGASDTAAWTDNGTSTSVTRGGLSLANGQTYFFNVKAENAAGLQSGVASSDGQGLDTTPPSNVAAVSDGGVSDVEYTTTNLELSAAWSDSTDPESGIKRYWYSIGTATGTDPGATNIVDWTDNGTATSVTHTGLALTNGTVYYFNVKAENVGGVLSIDITSSNGQMVDISAPDLVSPTDGTGADISYTTTNMQLQAGWTASADGESGVRRYWYSIGTSAGASDTVAWTDNGLNTSVTHSFATGVANGLTYYFTVKAENNAGLISAPVSTDGQIVDIDAPADITRVDDGTGADITYTADNMALAANWPATDDPETGVSSYHYAIGTSAGATDVVNWTDAGVTTSVTKTFASALSDGQVYYFSVKARNAAGLFSTPVNSNGQMVDTTAPAGLTQVLDGTGVDIAFQTVNTQLSANWPAAADPHSGLKKYWYSIGTSAGASDTVSWTDNALSASVTRAGLSLADGVTYYVTVKAENEASLLTSPVISSGVTADTTPPADVATVSDGTGADISFMSSTTQVSANWTASSDAHTGVAKYWYSVGTSAGAMDVAGWTDNGTNTSVTRSGLSLANGQTYYFNIKAENAAGLQSGVTSSDGQTVDTTPPSNVPAVTDGGVTDVAYTTTNLQLTAAWSDSSDPESGIRRYWYSIGTATGTNTGANSVVDWTDNGTATSVTHTGLALTNGTVYYFNVKAENVGGVLSTGITSSNGQMVDITAPDIVAPADGTGADITYTTTNMQLQAGWTASADGESGLRRYWYSIGTSSGASDTVAWTDIGLNTTVTHGFTTGVANGLTYYFTVKAENNAGLISDPVSTNGQLVDIDAPAVIARVDDGTGSDITYTTDNTRLAVNWTVTTDSQTGVSSYYYAIGTSAGATDVTDWTDVGVTTSVTKTFASPLSDGQIYYFSVKARNAAGLISTPVNSSGQMVDTTAPSAITQVLDGTSADLAFQTVNTRLSANWTASADPHSGLKKYWYSIGTSAGASDTVSWTDNALAASVMRTGLSLADGVTYYITVKAENHAGLLTEPATSSGVTVDTTPPPAVATVNDGAGPDTDIVTSTSELSANWSAVSDPHTTFVYLYSVGSVPGASNTIAWTETTQTAVTVSGLSLTDGAGYYFNVKVRNAAGLETVVGSSDGATVNQGPPAVSLTPLPGELSGIVEITGSVSDLSLVSWAIEYGPGSSPAAWKQIAAGTQNLTDGKFTDWDTSALSGAYTLRLHAEDTLEGSSTTTISVTVKNTMTVTGTIPGGVWGIVSIPAVPAGTSLVDLFGGDAVYKIFRWEPLAEEDPLLNRYRVPTTLSAGMSFWIISHSGDLPYSYNVSVNDTSRTYNIPLSNGWNQIGSPFNHEFPWGQVMVSDGSSTYDLDTAAANGLVSKTIFAYDPVSAAWLSKDENYSLPVQGGVFVRAFRDVTLSFDPGAGRPGGIAKIVRPSFDYLLKLSASSRSAADPDNFVGASPAAADGFDKLDAPEPPAAPGGAFTRLSFSHGDWGAFSGAFTSDIRASARRRGDSAAWKFKVETNESGKVTISWDGGNLPEGFSFTLLPEGLPGINMAETDFYEYFAEAAGGVDEKDFQVLVTALLDVLETRSFTLSPGWNLVAVPVDPVVTNAVRQLADDLKDINFYQFLGGKYYEGPEADIQAGIGYWIHSDGESTITIEGIPVPDFIELEVPLEKGWNIIGNPFDSTLNWGGNIKVKADGVEMSLDQAAAAGVLDPVLRSYENGAYRPLGAGAGLETWKGYLLSTAKKCTLVLKKK